jgi:O-antigen biosynthesis protein WbqP
MLSFFFILPILIIGFIIWITTHESPLYWSKRVGKNNTLFNMPKFRTMRSDTPQLATHLLDDPDKWLTPIGRILRRHSLDELLQLWNILKGEMSFVGPRPALFNQDDLIKLRTEKDVHTITPGLTGWAQINGRDHLTIPEKVEFDEYYLKKKSLLMDLKILVITVFKVIKKEAVKH